MATNEDKIVSDFTPVGDVTTDFTPMDDTKLESEAGFKRRRAEAADRPHSTATGAPIPTSEEKIQAGKEVVAAGVRYGPPIIAGIASGGSLSAASIAIQAIVNSGSEYAARRIERVATDPEMETHWDDLKAGGIAGLLDAGINALTLGMGKAFHAIGRKLFIPSEIPTEIRIAQDVLGTVEPTAQKDPTRRFIKWLRSQPTKRPFSLTYGQLNAEEKNFVTWLEGAARAGIGSRGVMAKFDTRNEKAVIDLIERYIEERATKLTGPEFGRFARRILGDKDIVPRTHKVTGESLGEMFLPVQAYRKYLYKQFEDTLATSGMIIDLSNLRRYFNVEGRGIMEGLPDKVYGRLRSVGLVPPLQPTSTARKSITRTSTTKTGETVVNQASDLTRTDLLTGKTSRTAQATQGTRLVDDAGQVESTRISETLTGLTEAEVAAEWKNIPASDANQIVKIINTFWKDGDNAYSEVVKHMSGMADSKLKGVINKYKDANGNAVLKELHETADKFFVKDVHYMRDDAIKSLRNTLTKEPEKALAILGGGTETKSARDIYSKLLKLKEALFFSSETPRVGAALTRATSKTGFPTGSRAIQEMYDKTFLQPLRYGMITGHIDDAGKLTPNHFLSMLEKGSDTPEFFHEVFGGEAQFKAVKDLMTTLSILQQAPTEKNIFVQLMQAGQITGGLGGVIGTFASDDPRIEATSIAGGIAILLSPYALSKAFTNTNTIRGLTNGLTEGIRSSKLALSLRKIAEMKAVSTLYRDAPTRNAAEFYTTIPGGEQTTQ